MTQHGDARFDEALPLLRGVVLGVLAKVAELAGPLDLLRQLVGELPIELADLVFEAFDQSRFHRSSEYQRGPRD